MCVFLRYNIGHISFIYTKMDIRSINCLKNQMLFFNINLMMKFVL